MADKRLQRYQAIDKIRGKGFYILLLEQPFHQKISADFKKFPNQLLNQISSSLDYIQNQQDLYQIMKVSSYSGLFEEFNKAYEESFNTYQYWMYMQQQQMQRLALLQQQQQQYGGYGQNNYQNQYGQQNQYNQQNQGQYGGQNQGQYGGQNQYGQNQGQYGQNQNQYHHNKNYQNYDNQTQRPHYNKQRQQNNGQNRGGYNQYNYQNQHARNQYGHQNNNGQQHYGQNQHGQHQNQNGQSHYQPKTQYNLDGTYKKKNIQNNNYSNQQTTEVSNIPPPPPQEPKKIVQIPKPQKPELKPSKFSLAQIKSLIGAFNDKQNENVNKDLIAKIQQVKSWKQGEVSFDQKQQRAPQFKKNQSKRQNYNNQNNQGKFDKGKNYTPTPDQPEGQKKDTGLSIVIGKNQTLQTKLIKQQIKGKAGQDFATIMEQQQGSLSILDKAKKQIVYNLNLLAPQNIKDIQRDLTPFLYQNKEICEVLIGQIIQKAWTQPKYASTYAKLCFQFSKIPQANFKFHQIKGQKNNPFKRHLISTVQHSFDKKTQKLPEFNDNQQKQTFLKETKKKILGNVKFIAELIRSKILKKLIMKICMTQLISTFLQKYENFIKTGRTQDSYYDYYFQALIEFCENVGDYFEKMDKSTDSYEAAQKVIIGIVNGTLPPPNDQIKQISDLNPDDYFKVFSLLDSKIIRITNSRLSALLQNLEQRRTNNWVKHHSEGEGPKKLKDIKQDFARQQEQMNRVKSTKKASIQHLNELVKVMFKDWENSAKNQRGQIKKILKEFSQLEFYSAYLSQVADQKKENVSKRVELFDLVLEQFYNAGVFKTAWLDIIKNLAFSSSDFPFCGAALAKILMKLKQKKSLNLGDYYLKSQDEDEQFFMNEVYDKLYHYSNWEEIKQFTQPSKKPSGML